MIRIFVLLAFMVVNNVQAQINAAPAVQIDLELIAIALLNIMMIKLIKNVLTRDLIKSLL